MRVLNAASFRVSFRSLYNRCVNERSEHFNVAIQSVRLGQRCSGNLFCGDANAGRIQPNGGRVEVPA